MSIFTRRSLALVALPLLSLSIASAQPDPDAADPVQGLTELSQRTHIRPFKLTQDATGGWGSERTVYKDTVTGSTVWQYSRNPGYDHHGYSNKPTWSRDGKWLVVSGQRGTQDGYFLCAADGSSWKLLDGDFSNWSKSKPHSAFFIDGNKIVEKDVETGETRVIWDKVDSPNASALQVPSEDGKKLLYTSGKGARAKDETTSTAWLIDIDGKTPAVSLDLHGVVHQIWFLRRPDYAFTFNYEITNDSFKEGQWMCEPEKGGKLTQLDEAKFPHAGISPDGKYLSTYRNKELAIFDIDARKLIPVLDAKGWHHTSWDNDPKSLIATIGNGLYVVHPFAKSADLITEPFTHLQYGVFETEGHPQSSPDGTKIGYDSTMLGDCDYYAAVGKLPESPINVKRDGKTLSWSPPARCMELAGYCVYLDGKPLNRHPITVTQFELPSAVGTAEVTAVEHSGLESKRDKSIAPAAPNGLAAKPLDPFTVHLAWTAAPELDVAYYNVYASTGDVTPQQKSRIASPVANLCTDWGLQEGKAYHYVVTAVNRAGTESAPSSVITVNTPAINAFAIEKSPTGDLATGPAEIKFDVPAAADCAVWVQLESIDAGVSTKLKVTLDGTDDTWRPNWGLVAGGRGGSKFEPAKIPFWDTLSTSADANQIHHLAAGAHTLTFNTGKDTAKLLKVTITNDLGFVPAGITSFMLTPAQVREAATEQPAKNDTAAPVKKKKKGK